MERFTSPDFQADKYISETRGYIIHMMVILEELMDECLAFYFCGKENQDKCDDFKRMMLLKAGVSLQLKAITLRYIIKNRFAEIDNEFPKFRTTFTKVVEFRNVIAHTKFNPELSGRELDGSLKLLLFNMRTEDNKPFDEFISLDKGSIGTRMAEIQQCVDVLGVLYNKLILKSHPL